MSDASNTPSDEGGEGPCLAHLFDDAEGEMIAGSEADVAAHGSSKETDWTGPA
jgi:hypothetical protein